MQYDVIAFAMPGLPEMLIVAGIFVLLFGASALPKFARSLGQALPSFKKGMAEVENEVWQHGPESVEKGHRFREEFRILQIIQSGKQSSPDG